MTEAPNGLVGAAKAFEGIPDGTCLLHGQRGCRRCMLRSQDLLVRPDRQHLKEDPFYEGSTNLPYSRVVSSDYVNRTQGKLEAAVRRVAREDYGVIGLVTSNGPSMVGDDPDSVIRGIGSEDRFIVMDSEDLEGPVNAGFDLAISETVARLTEKRETVKGTVNILGFSIMHRDWDTVLDEFTKILMRDGIKVISAPGAGSDTKSISESSKAEFNLILDPDYCTVTERFYRETFGIPSIGIGCCPVGFDALLDLYSAVTDSTGCGLSHGRMMVNKTKKRAYERIIASGKDLFGMTFDIISTDSLSVPLSRWLSQSFGMVRTSDNPDFLFADGRTALVSERSGQCGRGIDIGFPYVTKPDFVRTPVMGMDGALYILDRLFS